MKKAKRFAALFLGAAMVLGLVGCGGNAATADSTANGTTTPTTETSVATTPESVSGDTRILYTNGGPEEFFETPWLNPGTYMYNKTLYAHMIVADKNLNPIQDDADALATYNFSDDGKTLTFQLKDAYWHDGEKVTPEDIKWSIEYVSKTAVINPVFLSTFKAIEGAVAEDGSINETFSGIVIDGNTITITFSGIAPDALLAFTQFAPVPRKYFENVDPLKVQQAEYFQKPVGSGPFMVGEVSMNNYTTLVPFEKYYNGVADFTIQLLPSAGDSDPNLVTRAMAGNLDYGYTKMVADIQALETVQNVTLNPVDVRYTRMFYLNKFNNKDGSPAALADARVRQALRYAIDMKTICETLFNGAAVPADVLIPGESDKASGLNRYEYNPEKAKELLAEANWDSNTVIKTVFYYTDQATVDLMTAIQAYLAEVGVKMEFQLVEGDLATILWSAPADQTNGPRVVDWDMCYAANAALSLHEYYDRYHSGSGTNSHTPKDDKLDALLDATNASPDASKQIEAFKELTKYENENMFVMALYYQPIYVISSNRVQGIPTDATPQYCTDWHIQDWVVN